MFNMPDDIDPVRGQEIIREEIEFFSEQ